jgi:hypothetical protein
VCPGRGERLLLLCCPWVSLLESDVSAVSSTVADRDTLLYGANKSDYSSVQAVALGLAQHVLRQISGSLVASCKALAVRAAQSRKLRHRHLSGKLVRSARCHAFEPDRPAVGLPGQVAFR